MDTCDQLRVNRAASTNVHLCALYNRTSWHVHVTRCYVTKYSGIGVGIGITKVPVLNIILCSPPALNFRKIN